MSDKKVVHVGPGLPALLTVLFVGLKLTGHIDWSWWWVFSPLWISALAVAAIFVVVFLFLLAGEWIKAGRR